MEWRRATAGLTPEVAGQIGRVKGRTTTAKECGVGVKLFVGLGNPGAKYAANRHNIGFMAVDRIAADHGFAPWKKAFQGEVAEGRFGSQRVILLKPGTFMNLSGQSVRAAVDFHKIALDDVTVFHDELDLAPGKCRVKQGGGHAGHNGLRSLHAHLGEGYARVRLGIGHPGHKDRVAGYVLSDFAKADGDWLDDLLRGISDGASALAAGDTAGSRTRSRCAWRPPGRERARRRRASPGRPWQRQWHRPQIPPRSRTPPLPPMTPGLPCADWSTVSGDPHVPVRPARTRGRGIPVPGRVVPGARQHVYRPAAWPLRPLAGR
jgi:peptidyl-tRNA hydrolase, PTH1 family